MLGESSWFQQGAQQKDGEGREGDDCIRLREVKNRGVQGTYSQGNILH